MQAALLELICRDSVLSAKAIEARASSETSGKVANESVGDINTMVKAFGEVAATIQEAAKMAGDLQQASESISQITTTIWRHCRSDQFIGFERFD